MSRSFDRVSSCSSGSALALFAALSMGGCSDASEPQSKSSAERASGSLYAVMYEVFTADDSDSYLSIFDTLDIDALDTKRAREFAGGRAYMQTYNEWVFVGEPSSPIIHRYSLGRGGELTDQRDLSLGNFGIAEASIDDWGINFVSPTKAYYFSYEDGTIIVWNPSTMEITGEIDPPVDYLRDGFETNCSTAAVRGNRLYRSIYWEDTESAERSPDQMLLVYDTDEDRVVASSTETRCAALGNRTYTAEDGTIYFSNWIWPISDTILNGAPPHCALRINPDADTFDPEWKFEYADIASGREGAMFTYLEDGKGLVSIFHDEEAHHDETTDAWDYAANPNWELWNIDIEARTGSPVEGVPRNTGAYTPVQIDGREFVMIPGEGWEKTQLYELDGTRAKPYVDIPGWSYMFTKLR